MIGVGNPVPQGLAGESKFQWLTRVGFFARGLLYIVIALLVLGTGRTEDLPGALAYLGDGAGRLLLVVMAAGLATYGLWRLADAALGMEHPGRGCEVWAKRSFAGIVGAIYLYLAYKAFGVLRAGSSAAANAQQQADSQLDLPGGALILYLAALVMVVAAIVQVRTALSCSFLAALRGPAHEPMVKWLGRLGYFARCIIFLAVAYLIARAAAGDRERPEAGMEQALDFLSGPLLYSVAAGLMLFGFFSIIEAVYRRIQDAPVDDIKREVSEKLS